LSENDPVPKSVGPGSGLQGWNVNLGHLVLVATPVGLHRALSVQVVFLWFGLRLVIQCSSNTGLTSRVKFGSSKVGLLSPIFHVLLNMYPKCSESCYSCTNNTKHAKVANARNM